MSVLAPGTSPARLARRTTTRPTTVAGAMVLLLAAYLVCSLADDPRGTLGSDSGGKLATLAAMERHGALDPDVGYWAEAVDPNGDLHPLYYTAHLGGRWVNVTTLPMLVVAFPLFVLGGTRAALLLPMLGAVFAALAARALARRIGGGEGWWAFWAVGLASPIAVYALDFWEHAPGVALVLWGVVFAFDVVEGRAAWRAALASGTCFAAAATMRTDALVYATTTFLVAAVLIRRRGRTVDGTTWRPALGAGSAWLGGFGAVVLANQLLERAVIGGGIRTGRTARTAGAAGSGLADRVKEAVTTVVGLNGFPERTDWVLGAATVGLVAYAAWKLVGPEGRDRMLGGAALAGATLLFGLRLASGLGFVPGLLSASPLAVVGVAVGWTARRWRALGAVAVIAVPVVWAFQYSGGANPQWGGRYLLSSGALLVVGAAVVLAATPGWPRVAFVALGAMVTLAGVAWLSQRSHAVAGAMPRLAVDDHTVLVSREAHLLREGGAFYRPGARWLTAVGRTELRRAARIAETIDARRLAVVAVPGRAMPARIGVFERGERTRVEFLPGLEVVMVTYGDGEGR